MFWREDGFATTTTAAMVPPSLPPALSAEGGKGSHEGKFVAAARTGGKGRALSLWALQSMLDDQLDNGRDDRNADGNNRCENGGGRQ